MCSRTLMGASISTQARCRPWRSALHWGSSSERSLRTCGWRMPCMVPRKANSCRKIVLLIITKNHRHITPQFHNAFIELEYIYVSEHCVFVVIKQIKWNLFNANAHLEQAGSRTGSLAFLCPFCYHPKTRRTRHAVAWTANICWRVNRQRVCPRIWAISGWRRMSQNVQFCAKTHNLTSVDLDITSTSLKCDKLWKNA